MMPRAAEQLRWAECRLRRCTLCGGSRSQSSLGLGEAGRSAARTLRDGRNMSDGFYRGNVFAQAWY